MFGYEVLGPIAAGAFSTVLRARHIETGKEVRRPEHVTAFSM